VPEPHRRFIIVYLLTLGVVAAILTGFNAVIDPFGAYRVVPAVGEHRDTFETRPTRAEIVRHEQWDTLLFGSSLVVVGLDPTHPALGTSCYNLGLSGGSLEEQEAALDYVRRHNETTRIVYVLDLEYFDERTSVPLAYGRSPFNPAYSPLEYHASNLLGMEASELSIRTLRRMRDGAEMEHDERGGRIRPLVPAGMSQRVLFDLAGPAIEERGAPRISERRLERFERMVASLLDEGVDLFIVIPPAHATALDAQFADGGEGVGAWKSRLAEIVERQNLRHAATTPAELWDFSGYDQWSTEPVPAIEDVETRLRGFWDSRHFTKELGDRMLARMLERSGDDSFGVRLGPGNITAHNERQRDDYARRVRTR